MERRKFYSKIKHICGVAKVQVNQIASSFASLEETLALRRRVLTKSVFLLWCFLPDSLTPSVDGSTAY
ncbi:hypothetical protein T07_13873 [Trichinella nelsoni]|uniref:Uncharacterized protein n=1 Tax=Trichinella nelsoni TaxID=6336 RepID=A0A0V0SKK0_9BILA|nr:hypothetical protein T07_13873 [Trichinella nelsoni]